MTMKKCKAEPCDSRKMTNGKVSLMVGVHVDDTSGENNVCDKFYNKLNERFPVNYQLELKMYTGCAFERV